MPLAAVVSDNTDFVIVISRMLDSNGWATLTAREPTAVASIKRERPELVVFDLRDDRPDSTWTLLDMLRKEQVTRNTPVLVSSEDKALLRECADVLAEFRAAPLPRPFTEEELTALVSAVVPT